MGQQLMPIIIIAGRDLSKMSPEELGQMSTRAQARADVHTLEMLELFIAAQLREWERTGVFGDGRELSYQELHDTMSEGALRA